MFDRTKIMQAAWQIARNRARYYRETITAGLRAGLRLAWSDAKFEAVVAANIAWQAAARVARFAAMTIEQLRNSVAITENSDRLGHAGMQDLVDLRGALANAQRPPSQPDHRKGKPMMMEKTEEGLNDLLDLVAAADVLAEGICHVGCGDEAARSKISALCSVVSAAKRDGSALARQFDDEVADLKQAGMAGAGAGAGAAAAEPKPGHDAAKTDIPLTINGHALDRLSLPEMLALRQAVGEGWNWPDVAGVLVEPIWSALIAAVEAKLATMPPQNWADFCHLTLACCDDDWPVHDGPQIMSRWAQAAMRGELAGCPI